MKVLNLNLSGNGVILDIKRKRGDTGQNILGHGPELGRGPENMLLDGPQNDTGDKKNGLDDSKNLQRAGSGLQTRRVL